MWKQTSCMYMLITRWKKKKPYALSDGGEEGLRDSPSAYILCSTSPLSVLFRPAQSTFADARQKLPILLHNWRGTLATTLGGKYYTGLKMWRRSIRGTSALGPSIVTMSKRVSPPPPPPNHRFSYVTALEERVVQLTHIDFLLLWISLGIPTCTYVSHKLNLLMFSFRLS